MIAGLDGVSEDKILTIIHSTSEDIIHKSKTSRLWNQHILSYPLVVTSDLTSPSLHLGRLSSQPKPSLPSLTHQVFENQHIWPRWPIYTNSWANATNSFPEPGRLLWQKFSMVLLKIKFWQSPSQLTKTAFTSMKRHAFEIRHRW